MDDLDGVSLPGYAMEVDPNLEGSAISYTQLVYLPGESEAPSAPETPAANVWQQYVPSAEGSQWFASGAAGTASGCTLSTRCTYEELQEAFPEAEVTFSVSLTKGRDNEFVGAVDAFRVNDTVFDFEPLGTRGVPVPAPAPAPESTPDPEPEM